MAHIEKDPRDIAYLALYIAVSWYQEIPSPVALRLVDGVSQAKPGKELTPKILEEIKKVIANPNFKSIDSLVRRFKINKYEIYERLSGIESATEEVLVMVQVEAMLKRLRGYAENCAGDCDKCSLDVALYNGITLCELLCDLEFDSKNKIVQTSRVYPKYTRSILTGKVSPKVFKIDVKAIAELDAYREEHKDEKVQDIVSLALLGYIENSKKKPGH